MDRRTMGRDNKKELKLKKPKPKQKIYCFDWGEGSLIGPRKTQYRFKIKEMELIEPGEQLYLNQLCGKDGSKCTTSLEGFIFHS